MRRSIRLVCLVLAFSGAAEAQQPARSKSTSATALGLRGAVAPDVGKSGPSALLTLRAPAREPVTYGAQRVVTPLSSASPATGEIAQQCRMSCAQTYYFCLAGNQGDDCPTSWGQCRAACNAEPLPSSY